jgi:hypothetical protein
VWGQDGRASDDHLPAKTHSTITTVSSSKSAQHDKHDTHDTQRDTAPLVEELVGGADFGVGDTTSDEHDDPGTQVLLHSAADRGEVFRAVGEHSSERWEGRGRGGSQTASPSILSLPLVDRTLVWVLSEVAFFLVSLAAPPRGSSP